MTELNVDYVLVIFGGVIGYSGDDINKFLWMVRIAEGEHPNDIRSENRQEMMTLRSVQETNLQKMMTLRSVQGINLQKNDDLEISSEKINPQKNDDLEISSGNKSPENDLEIS